MGKGKERDLETIPEFKIKPGGPWPYNIELYPRDCYGRQIIPLPREVYFKRLDTICSMIIAQGGEFIPPHQEAEVTLSYYQKEVATIFYVKKVSK